MFAAGHASVAGSNAFVAAGHASVADFENDAFVALFVTQIRPNFAHAGISA